MRKIIDVILMLINSIMPKNNNKIVFSSMPDYSDNPKALYEYIKNNHLEKHDLIWICYDQDIIKKLNDKGIKAYDRKSLKGIWHTITSRYIVSSHYNLISVKSKNQTYVNLWHGMPLKTMAFLENQYTNNVNLKDKVLKNRKKEVDKIDYMSATSNIMKLALAGCFYIDPRKILVLGQCRNDYLFEDKSVVESKLDILISNDSVKNYSKVIMYLPTMRKGMGANSGYFDNNSIMNVLNYNKEKFEQFLKENNYLLVVKLHPAEETQFNEFKGNNIIIIKSKEMTNKLITINEIISASDLLITDYSSVYFDYLNVDKPIIFINTDEEVYKSERGFIFDNADMWRPGPKVKDMSLLIEEIDKSLNNIYYYKEERYNINNMVNKFKDSCSSQRIYEHIFEKNR